MASLSLSLRICVCFLGVDLAQQRPELRVEGHAREAVDVRVRRDEHRDARERTRRADLAVQMKNPMSVYL